MPRRSSCPDRALVSEALDRVGSISALARYYGISFATARRWVARCDLGDSLKTENHVTRLKQLVSEGPTRARRSRIDGELALTLTDIGSQKLLARAIVDEFSMRYVFKKCFSWERYVLKLTLVMYDLPPVEEIARLVGVPSRMRFRRAKSGVKVPYWSVNIEGYRAFRILQLTRPYMTGQKAFQSDIALRSGPICNLRVFLGKDIYRQNMLSSLGIKIE